MKVNFCIPCLTYILIILNTLTTAIVFGQEIYPQNNSIHNKKILNLELDFSENTSLLNTNYQSSNCGHDKNEQSLKVDKEYIQSKQKAEVFYINYLKRKSVPPSLDTLPVVFHIIHDGHSLGSVENPTDDEVVQRINTINDNFRFVSGNSYSNPFSGVDTEIEICLAKKDANGNFSKGIIRHDDSLVFNAPGNELINAINTWKWDTSKYLNVFLIRYIPGGVLGTYYGGSIDVVAQRSVTSAQLSVHEIGHYLNLSHIFLAGCPNFDCLSDGDFVCDTPPKAYAGHSGTCGNPGNSCTTDSDDASANNPYRDVSQGGIGDQPDIPENYMDYTEGCWGAFTIGQKSRMKSYIASNRQSVVDNASVVCNSNYVPDYDLLISSISTNDTICNTHFTPEIILKNLGSNTVTSAEIFYYLNDVLFHSQTWNGNLVTNSEVNVASDSPLLKSEGRHKLKIVVTNPNGFADEFSNDNQSSRYVSYFYNNLALPYSTTYPEFFFPPLWEIEQSNMKWFMSGYMPLDSCLNNYRLGAYKTANIGSSEQAQITLPPLNLQNFSGGQLSFDYGYLPYNISNPDTLSIFATTQCGIPTLIWQKTDFDLATNNPPSYTNSFSYPNCAQISHINIDISSFACSPQVSFRFVISGYGRTPLILDKVEVINTAPCVPEGCTYLISPSQGQMDILPVDTLSWLNITNVNGYKITAGYNSGASDIVDLIDVGLDTNYVFQNPLLCDSTVFVTITPYGSGGDNTGCPEEFFYTFKSQNCDPNYSQIDMGTNISSPLSIHINDLNNDGLNDVIAGSSLSELSWFKNDPSGIFTKYVIANDLSGITGIIVDDLDLDLDNDILTSLRYDNKVIAWLNDGNQNFLRDTIDDNLNRAEGVAAVDLDGDLDIDIISIGWQIADLYWYENDGNFNFTKHLINGALFGATNIHIVDIDQDNDIDILVAAQTRNEISLWLNDGVASFTKVIVDSNITNASGVFAGDINNDNIIDIAACSRNDEVSWYSHDGNYNFIKTKVDTIIDDVSEIVIADVNLDNIEDLIVSAAGNDNIVIYINDTMQTFTKHVVLAGVGDVWDLEVDDLNGDFVADIGIPLNDLNKISYLKNNCTILPFSYLINPENTDTNVAYNTCIEWFDHSNSDGYFIAVGTELGFDDIVNYQDVNNSSQHCFSQYLSFGDTIHVSIFPYVNNELSSFSYAYFVVEECPAELPLILDPIPSGSYYFNGNLMLNNFSITPGSDVEIFSSNSIQISPTVEIPSNSTLLLNINTCVGN